MQSLVVQSEYVFLLCLGSWFSRARPAYVLIISCGSGQELDATLITENGRLEPRAKDLILSHGTGRRIETCATLPKGRVHVDTVDLLLAGIHEISARKLVGECPISAMFATLIS